MIRRLYVENFRCLGQFSLELGGMSSVLLVGRNGAGKTALREALHRLRKVALGRTGIGDAFSLSDFNWNTGGPKMAFLLQIEVGHQAIDYELELTVPEGSSAIEVALEQVRADGKTVLDRDRTGAAIIREGEDRSLFPIDDHLLALPFLSERKNNRPIAVLRRWLSNLLILAPIPDLITGESLQEDSELAVDCSNFAEWFRHLTVSYPASIASFIKRLHQVWPDFQTVINSSTGRQSKSLDFRFKDRDRESSLLPLAELSHGERCLVIWAAVLTWSELNDSGVCFWDEPDSHISLDELANFIRQTTRTFNGGNQFIATSQNPEAIRNFSGESTFVLRRTTHLDSTDPPVRASDLGYSGDLGKSISRGEIFGRP